MPAAAADCAAFVCGAALRVEVKRPAGSSLVREPRLGLARSQPVAPCQSAFLPDVNGLVSSKIWLSLFEEGCHSFLLVLESESRVERPPFQEESFC